MATGDLHGLVVVVVVGAAILVGGWLAARLHIASPIVHLLIGAPLGFIPQLGDLTLTPALVLLLFLPALLYWESINTSLREIRSNLATIGMLAVGLVLASALLVAGLACTFGLSWAAALTLGVVLAPTDATAAIVIARNLPRTALTILRAESLVNDGTALVLYAVAVHALVMAGAVSVGSLAVRFLLSYAGGVLIGLVVGMAAVAIRHLLRHEERLLNSTLSVLTPFIAYLPAEALGVSGVVAVVAGGLLISQWAPPTITASMRAQSFGFWQLGTYLLSSGLFVLLGIELHNVLRELGSHWSNAAALSAVAAVAILGLRVAWNLAAPAASLLRHPPNAEPGRWRAVRQRVPLGWAGSRGAVSLATALAVPLTDHAGHRLQERNTIVAVTFIVILITLVGQGVSMPAVLRWARLAPDPSELDEELLAEQEILRTALARLPEIARRLRVPASVHDTLSGEYRSLVDRIHREEGDPSSARREHSDYDYEIATRLALIPPQRATLFRLRDQGRIDDVILRRIQARLDLEELRLQQEPELD